MPINLGLVLTALQGGRLPRSASGQVLRPVADLSKRAALNTVLVWQPVGLLLVVCHVLLVKSSIWLFPVAPILLGWLYLRSPLSGATVFFQILVYQNLIVSIFSPGMDYRPTWEALEGTNFVALCVIALAAFSRLLTPHWWRQWSGVIWLVLLALAMAALYSIVGAAKAGPTSALVYFRNFMAPLLGVFVGLDIGRTWGFKTLGTVFLLSIGLAILIGIVEYTIPADFYGWMNEVTFDRLRYTMQPEGNVFFVPEDIVEHFTNAFFDISGGTIDPKMTTFRFGGPIITPTSFAYILSVAGLVSIAVRRSAWLWLILPLMLLDGAKGALLLFVFSVVLWTIWNATRSKAVVAISGVALGVFYIGMGILIGLENNDYHVVGFLGGLHGLFSDPMGHGLGVGGNMSAAADAGFRMEGKGGFTRMGASFGVESAVGVLFYQTGIACVYYFAVFAAIVYKAPLGRRVRNGWVATRADLLIFALAMVVLNGVFQEEAYSPYAAGTIALLCSCLLANGRRQQGVLGQTQAAAKARFAWGA
jgi:hypothetical protein